MLILILLDFIFHDKNSEHCAQIGECLLIALHSDRAFFNIVSDGGFPTGPFHCPASGKYLTQHSGVLMI